VEPKRQQREEKPAEKHREREIYTPPQQRQQVTEEPKREGREDSLTTALLDSLSRNTTARKRQATVETPKKKTDRNTPHTKASPGHLHHSLLAPEDHNKASTKPAKPHSSQSPSSQHHGAVDTKHAADVQPAVVTLICGYCKRLGIPCNGRPICRTCWEQRKPCAYFACRFGDSWADRACTYIHPSQRDAEPGHYDVRSIR
jgi:hypothetical protein